MRGFDTRACPFRVAYGLRADRPDIFVFDERMVDRLTPVGAGFLSTAQPDLTDPATVGCLLALLREAAGDPTVITVQAGMGRAHVAWETGSGISSARRFDASGDLGDAAAAALIALAQEVPHVG